MVIGYILITCSCESCGKDRMYPSLNEFLAKSVKCFRGNHNRNVQTPRTAGRTGSWEQLQLSLFFVKLPREDACVASDLIFKDLLS